MAETVAVVIEWVVSAAVQTVWAEIVPGGVEKVVLAATLVVSVTHVAPDLIAVIASVAAAKVSAAVDAALAVAAILVAAVVNRPAKLA